MDPLVTKRCLQCCLPKPISEFGRIGLGQFCTSCKAQRKTLAADRSRRKHPEPHRRSSRRYAQAHPDKQAHAQQRWRLKNVEHCQRYNATYYAEHAETERARSRHYHAEHAEELRAYLRAWHAANPHKRKLYDMRRYARRAGLPSTMTEAQVTYLYHYWHFACAVCGREVGLFGLKLVLDHWIPVTAPHCPGTVATNIVLLCHGPAGCNNSKNNCAADTWLRRRFGTRKARQILQRIETYFAVVRARESSEPSTG